MNVAFDQFTVYCDHGVFAPWVCVDVCAGFNQAVEALTLDGHDFGVVAEDHQPSAAGRYEIQNGGVNIRIAPFENLTHEKIYPVNKALAVPFAEVLNVFPRPCTR